MSNSILIVEDDRQQRRYLAAVLSAAGFEVDAHASAEPALARLTGTPDRRPDLCLLDLNLSGIDGRSALERLRAAGVQVPVIVLAADGSVSRAVEAMRAGATDFLVKPIGPERLETSIRNALKLSALSTEVRRLARARDDAVGFDDLVAESAAIRRTIQLAQRAATSTIPVLISGESGTGKEVFARAIHGAGPRAGKPFVSVNCAAMPAHLAESILFGHESRGANDGPRRGKFQEAEGGTLFLDEVSELAPETQARLLRALQSREIDPVGAGAPVPTDVRLVCATNVDLAELAETGGFRADLFYRVSAFPLTLPPLRERREDLLLLAQMFLMRFAAAEDVAVRGFTEDAARLIEGADWPGNVRQLQNTVHRAVVLADGPRIRPEHLIGLMRRPEATPFGSAHKEDKPSHDAFIGEDGHIRKLADLEAEAIERALAVYHGRMAEVARRLGIGRSTLYRKLDELGLARKRA